MFLKFKLFLLTFLSTNILFGQVTETKNWCQLTCEYTVNDKVNTDLLHYRMNNDEIKTKILNAGEKRLPIRVAIVQQDSTESSISELEIRSAIDDLNSSFKKAKFIFYLDRIDLIISELGLEDLSQNQYNIYDSFSAKNDRADMITIYILDHKRAFCEVSENSISCGRTGGFSYILSEKTSNIVISKFDLEDPKVVAHELGHFFGLYHTFEEHLFGKDQFDSSSCHMVGDRICDTPPDPGTLYEVYVNYAKCEMVRLSDVEGNEYKPLIENVMSYYKPCYLKAYSFTDQQVEYMRLASELDIRKPYFR